MSLLGRLFTRRVVEPEASAAARALARHRCDVDRERVRQVAREMRARLGLPPLPALESPSRRNRARMKGDSA